MKKDKIILATGGTGGHVFPALALADELAARGFEVVFITDRRGQKYLCDTGYKFYVTSITGKNIAKLITSIFQALYFVLKIKPKRIVGFGGYPAFPPLLAGRILFKKIFVHEQNSVLGKVNKFFANKKNLAASFPDTGGTLVGNPVRKEITRSAFPPVERKINILITGGSQGARIFGEILPQAFLKFKDKIKITQQVVPGEIEHVKSFYKLNRIEAEIAPFFSDMQKCYAENHLVIARSGSSTIFELASVGRPAIFVPLGIAADNHQQINAEAVVKTGGAWMILEKDFNQEKVTELLSDLINNPAKLAEAAEKISKFAVADTAKTLADFILK